MVCDKRKVHVSKWHACHAKRRWMSPSAMPATWNEGGCEVVPRLPRKVPRRHRRPSRTKRATQCHLSHACHAKRWWMWHCATPATWNEGGCEVVPRLPRKVPRRHRRPSRTKRATQCHLSHACHANRRWMWHCATPATWNEGGCEVVPRLPRKVPRRHRRPSRTKRATQCHLSHACHAKRRWMWHCATPATWNEGGCEVVPRLPRKVPRRHRRPSRTKRATQCHLSHACHAKRRWMWHCATPATWNDGGCELCATPATWKEGGCHQVPRLPRKVPSVPRLPRKTTVDASLCHACHVKRRYPDQARHTVPWVPRLPRKTTMDVSCVPRYCMWSVKLLYVTFVLYAKLLCVKVCEVIVCEIILSYCMYYTIYWPLCVWSAPPPPGM